MLRVAVVNSKGGSGKTTLATNLASYFCRQQLKTALIDHDSQGSSSHWSSRRPATLNPIEIISAYKQSAGVTRSWFLRPARGTERVIIDSPSGLDVRQFKATLLDCDAIVIPVLPSTIDMHAVGQFIAEILKHSSIKREQGRIAVVANRTRKNTLMLTKLEQFLKSLGIPFIATLRDSQQYVMASEAGLGLFDLPRPSPLDIQSWQPLLEWINHCAQLPAVPPLSHLNQLPR